eukprot:1547591-Amphidinium_carterae.1
MSFEEVSSIGYSIKDLLRTLSVLSEVAYSIDRIQPEDEMTSWSTFTPRGFRTATISPPDPWFAFCSGPTVHTAS